MASKDTRSQSKPVHQELGKQAERLVAKYLQGLGFKIVACNYRYRKAEIDLIVEKDDCLVFVEVKARTSIQFGYPEEFVSAHQQKLIHAAAENYLLVHRWNQAIRFDIVAVLQKKRTHHISHFEDAF
jgi:putative endonuclease